jgi:hypothetical protein
MVSDRALFSAEMITYAARKVSPFRAALPPANSDRRCVREYGNPKMG